MKIYKIASIAGGYWITPNGKIIDVNYDGHAPYLINHPQEFNMTKKDIQNILTTSPKGSASLCSLATQKGALHVGIYYGLMYVDSNSISLAEQYKEQINQIAKKFKILPKWQIITQYSDNSDFHNKNTPIKIDINSYKNSLPIEPIKEPIKEEFEIMEIT